MTKTKTQRPGYRSSTMPMIVGMTALVLLVGGLGAWATMTRLAGAVVATGIVEVETNRQVIQHPEGGIVGEILAKDGQEVQAGDVVLKFDDTLLQLEMSVVTEQLTELAARKARMAAERDESSEITFDPWLIEAAQTDAKVADQLDGQRNLFEARLRTTEQQVEQLGKRIQQYEASITGINAQLTALRTQLQLIEGELEDQNTLLSKGLTQNSRVSALQREQASLAGRIGELISAIAQTKGQIATSKIEILRLKTARREEAIATLRDQQFQTIELTERKLALTERLGRLSVKSSVNGVIYDSQVFAERAVVQPGAPLMYVIPQDQPLIIAGRVDPIHIDQVYRGQPAGLRFSAFEQRTTPELFGNVMEVSADALPDDVTGQPYYRVEVLPKESEMVKLGDNTLLPGMPVEVFIKTDERTPLSYLTKPFTDYFNRAMRG
ncbi:HlyD family type I secretion periplasmic adaptor subunit [Falsiruegeria mediterranea]|jgi:membrane fusion protein, type I secretion system|uniref:Membrane fusion protein (MFP) family protein n=1 Tax=Falsiruegeria mediterranea M17 TaxID=1200281 RepID=A0A2R8CFS2_9RHOB|nr:HlyD family type I secretion periplasmic adaptor subunit [Falsiruegeria mediterranea]SPJ31303.1 Type I secretion system membrane fusion protein PrsE [Falsiruegeria mediterranea M17]